MLTHVWIWTCHPVCLWSVVITESAPCQPQVSVPLTVYNRHTAQLLGHSERAVRGSLNIINVRASCTALSWSEGWGLDGIAGITTSSSDRFSVMTSTPPLLCPLSSSFLPADIPPSHLNTHCPSRRSLPPAPRPRRNTQTFLYHRRSSPDLVVNLGERISYQLEKYERHPLPLPLPERMPSLPLPAGAVEDGEGPSVMHRSHVGRGVRADAAQQVWGASIEKFSPT